MDWKLINAVYHSGYDSSRDSQIKSGARTTSSQWKKFQAKMKNNKKEIK